MKTMFLAMLMTLLGMIAPVRAGTIAIDLVEDDGVAQLWLTAADQPEEIVGVQILLNWEPATATIDELTLVSALQSGFFGAWWNTDLADGDAVWVWFWDFQGDPFFVDPDGTHMADIWFDMVSVELWVVPGIGPETMILAPDGTNLWDGVVSTITIPEPASVLCLLGAIGLWMIRGSRTR